MMGPSVQTANPETSAEETDQTGRTPAAPAIAVDRLHHAYGERTALNGVSIQIAAGEIFGFLGPNGSGKTTLFKILTTLIRPRSGRVEIFGSDLTRHAGRVRHLLGVAFQYPSLDGKLTCAENLRHHGHLYGIRGKALEGRIDELLTRFGLADRAGDRTEKLSGGQRRRVELAKAVLHRPRLLLLDEPATGLDPGARQELWRDLVRLQKQDGVTVALTTHLMDEAEGCDRLAVMHEGKVVALGTPAELKSEIGGDVIYIEADDPQPLAAAMAEKFRTEAHVVDHRIRLEQPDAHRFIAQLFEAFPGAIKSVRIGQPTLEDVFVHRTGHRFWAEGETEDA